MLEGYSNFILFMSFGILFNCSLELFCDCFDFLRVDFGIFAKTIQLLPLDGEPTSECYQSHLFHELALCAFLITFNDGTCERVGGRATN